MSYTKIKTSKEEWDVEGRLAELRLSKEGLMEVVSTARHASADATDFHPANASGMFAYMQGVYALRKQFVGENWCMDSVNGVEMIRNDSLKIKVGFSNVDIACNDEHTPKARSTKGSGSERACLGNFFSDLPTYAPIPTEEYASYFVMVDSKGAAEISRPTISGNNFGPCVERIYLTDGSDFDPDSLFLDDEDVADYFDPQIVKK